MNGWMRRVGDLLGGRAATPGPAGDATASIVPAPTPSSLPMPVEAGSPVDGDASGDVIDLRLALFDWVVGAASLPTDGLRRGERSLLAHLDAQLASDEARASLLPRAPAVIPQLLNSLRDESQSIGALAQRVMRDPHLVAEVIRMANGAGARAAEPVTDIAEAIRRLGTGGLRRAIARVVLKPMFDGTADTLSARCAQRLWQHSDAQAAACQQEAAARGLDPFEGYLAGLMHNVGWTAALRAIDRNAGGVPGRFSQAFVAAFDRRRETFFATLVMAWGLTDGLTALGEELLGVSLAEVHSPIGAALRLADERATREMLGAVAEPGLPDAPPAH
jgi:hypothetical protein